MKERIDKERLHLFAPRDILVTHVEVEGIIFIEKLKEAVKNAVARNEILNSRVVIEKDGNAYYETQKFDDNPNDMSESCIMYTGRISSVNRSLLHLISTMENYCDFII